METKELIAKCLNGDEKAEFHLYERFHGAIYNICYRMVNQSQQAEDILQDVWVKAFNNLKSYDNHHSFYTWLKRVAINTCIDFQNKKGIQYSQLGDQHGAVAVKTEAQYWNDVDFNVKRVNQALMQLPDGYREIFCLYAMEGYDHNEIADILSINPNTSKSQYSRAKAKLKIILKEIIWTN